MNRFVSSFVSRSLCRRSTAPVRSLCTVVSNESKPLDIPPPAGGDRIFSPKITSLVDDISKLTLLEVADLNECLKKTLRIEAVAMAPAAAPAAQTAPAEEAEGQPTKVKTVFTVKLEKFDDTKKVPLIKEVKNVVDGMNLVQAKKFVESAPQILKSNCSKDEAEELKKKLEALGATIAID